MGSLDAEETLRSMVEGTGISASRSKLRSESVYEQVRVLGQRRNCQQPLYCQCRARNRVRGHMDSTLGAQREARHRCDWFIRYAAEPEALRNRREK